jgi:alpha-mannosidase
MERPSLTLIPHTHWDREWYQTFDQFLVRLVEMMDLLIDVMDREPGFAHFHLDGQATVIDDYLAVKPEREEDVRRLVKAGRISVGPWYTQMDEFLTSGESHIRNLEWGLRRAEELGAERPIAGYLPDQFGHIGQMPQILARKGLGQAVLWRGVPRAVDRTPFWWEGPDGSRVLTEYLIFSYSMGWALSNAETVEALSTGLEQAVTALSQASVRDRYLLPVGSDHHVPTVRLAGLLDQADEASGIDAHIGSYNQYLSRDGLTGDVPEWRGELRSAARAYLLPSVYSNRVHQKIERGRVEALLERYAEPLAALVPGVDWPEAELADAWRQLLWNGAHDSVCGCSLDEVARDVDGRFARARVLAEAVIERSLKTLAAQVDSAGTLRFNPSPFARDGVPGLGWAVGAERPGEQVVTPSVEGDWIVAGRVAVRLRDEGDVGDLYNWCPTDDDPRRGPDAMSIDGDEVVAEFTDASVRLRVVQREGDPFVRVETTIDNRRPDHRLRLHVRLPERSDGRSVAGAPFELVERPERCEAGYEPAWPSWPGRGVAMGGGAAVLHPGVFEYQVIPGPEEGPSELAVTLLRCTGTISRSQGFATRPGPAGPDIATPEAQMIGTHHFSIGVLPSATGDALLPAWERFALPLLEVEAPGGGSLPSTGSLLEVSGAEVSAIRKVDGTVEVRVWNPSSAARTATVAGGEIALGPAKIVDVTL